MERLFFVITDLHNSVSLMVVRCPGPVGLVISKLYPT